MPAGDGSQGSNMQRAIRQSPHITAAICNVCVDLSWRATKVHASSSGAEERKENQSCLHDCVICGRWREHGVTCGGGKGNGDAGHAL